MVRLVQLVASFALVTVLLSSSNAGEGDSSDLRGASTEELARILCTEPPTPELTEAIRSSRHRRLLGPALRDAAAGAMGEELMNFVAHMVRLGMCDGDVLGVLSRRLTKEAVIEGQLRKIYHPDLHVYTVEMDIRRVLAGSIQLTPENTPFRLLVNAMGCHARWIQIDWDPGTTVIAFAEQGDILFESRRLIVRGWTAYGTDVWQATGREEELLQLLAPLTFEDTDALLAGMQAEDAVTRWLATAQTVMVCHGLGEPFASWWSGLGRDVRLDQSRIEPRRIEAIDALTSLKGKIVWNDAEDRFEYKDESAPGPQAR